MKQYLSLIMLSALALTACSEQAAKPAEPAANTSSAAAPAPASTPAPAAEPAAASPAAASPAAASPAAASTAAPAAADAAVPAECRLTVEGNDQMQFNTHEIGIKKSCKSFEITLKHAGKMPAAAMGHNIVISTADDMAAVVADGAAAKVEGDYVKAGDTRIVAHSKLIGGGEEASFTVDTSKLDPKAAYKFFCSFPGHSSMMTGDVKLVD